jgi:enoyl-CoA hydratase/carnithine racemase
MSTSSEGATGAVRTEVVDRVAFVTIDRPEKRNALTRAMWHAIPEALRSLAARDDIVAVMLQGAGGNFGAGADLDDVVAATEGRLEAEAYCTDVVAALLAVATWRLPTFALVQGVAAGGGAELALACDLRIADPDASFAFPFARLGVVPDRFTLERLAALVGVSAARRLVFSGEKVEASRALAMGLVDEVIAPGGIASSVSAWRQTLSQGSSNARAEMKAVLGRSEASFDARTLAKEMVDSFVGGEVRAAALRFLEKRPP